jgi:serine/threonine-protein kinase
VGAVVIELMVAWRHSGDATAPVSTAAPTAVPRLELVDIDLSFGAVRVLKQARLVAHAGEIVGLCGDSGAGKSTLVRILGGVHPHGSYRGQVQLDGAPLRLGSPADSRRAGIAIVHQRATAVPQLSVAHNLMLGREPRRFGLVDGPRLESQARACLERFGLAHQVSPASLMGDLDAELQQIVEIVGALSRDARVVVLDEPAAALTAAGRERLFAWLRTLQRLEVACIYVTHRLDELIGLCDQITMLRDGTTAPTLSGAAPSLRAARGDRYLVHDEIAAGGMATVHLGKIRGPFGFTSTVAIKRLHPAHAKDPEFVAMFLDEARLASRVRHPNVVPVLDVIAEAGELSLVMEYVDGESLGELCRLARARAQPIAVAVAVAVAASILHGLHAAHEARDEAGALLGLVHRDVSPQNVLVGCDGVARLIDFGIAKAVGRHNASRQGQLKGKIAYVAPEQIQGGSVNRRTDVYGASVLLWELLTGERLFDGETEGMILGRVLDDEVPPPSSLRAGLLAGLDAIVLRGLDRAPERRYESAQAMARALEQAARSASADEVGQWVQSLAAESLAARREKLARLEQLTLAERTPATVTPVTTAPSSAPLPTGAPASLLARARARLARALRRG